MVSADHCLRERDSLTVLQAVAVALEVRVLADLNLDEQVTVRPAVLAGRAFALHPECLPVGDAGRNLTSRLASLRTTPLPRQVEHVSSYSVPSPSHRRQVVRCCTRPIGVCWTCVVWPWPLHSGHVSESAPGGCPSPSQSSQASAG